MGDRKGRGKLGNSRQYESKGPVTVKSYCCIDGPTASAVRGDYTGWNLDAYAACGFVPGGNMYVRLIGELGTEK